MGTPLSSSSVCGKPLPALFLAPLGPALWRRKYITQSCAAAFPPPHPVAHTEIELDGTIRPVPCDNCERILFKNTLPFVQPVSNI